MKRALGVLFALFLVLGATYLWFSPRFLVLTANHAAKVEINGAAVKADVLDGNLTAVVTLRESGNDHSYLLVFEGDTDSTGDTGSVVDCHEWIAPRSPLLLLSKYPSRCIPVSNATTSRWSLLRKNGSLQFKSDDQRTVRVVGLNK
jgi:hypothetical protein